MGLFGGGLSAQQISIEGMTVDATEKAPLSYATVSLYNSADSTLVTGGITAENGRFELKAAPGRYYLRAEFISYQPVLIADLNPSAQQRTLSVGTILMEPSATMMEEVVISEERSQTQLALDKKIFNVGKDLANAGSSAAELLDNVPSVQVDVEGNVSLRGSGSVRILVNGRPSGLVGIGGADGLRSIPANLIERVEVITNPSARYEAEGLAGIINIVLKKDKRKGLNGSFDIRTGVPDNYGTAVNLNMRREAFNLFANLGGFYRKGPGESSLYQEFTRNDTLFLLQQNGQRERGGWSTNFRTGADIYLSPRSTITTTFNYRYGLDDNVNEITYRDYLFSLDNLQEITVRRDNEEEEDPSLEYALTYTLKFPDEDQKLTADVRWQDDTEEERSSLTENYFAADFSPMTSAEELLQRTRNTEQQNQLVTQIDYVQPVGEEGKFEAGYRGSFRQIKNDFLVEEQQNGSFERIDGLSNDFLYDEDILAAYTSYGNKHGKWSYLLGLRLEHSIILTELKETNEVNERSYTNLFPSAFLNYEFSQSNALQVSYSRRVNRPRFWYLNPFFTFSDNRNFRTGNPNLDPEFTHSGELSYLRFWEKGTLSSSVYYRYTEGNIDRIRTLDENGNSLTRPENLNTETSFGLEFTGSYKPWEWLDLDANANFFRVETDGGNLGDQFRAEANTFFGRFTSRLEIDKKTDGQIRFNYSAPRNNTQGRTKSLYSLDLGFSREILNDRGTLTLSVRDVFNSRRRRYVQVGDNFYSEGDFQWRARQATLTLSYRLNQQQRRRAGNRDGGGDYDGEY